MSKNNKKTILIIVVILISFCIMYLLYNIFFHSKRLNPNVAKQIINEAKASILKNNTGESNKHSKAFIKAADYLNNDRAKIHPLKYNVFTVTNSPWIFIVNKNTAYGTYVGENYFAFIILEKKWYNNLKVG